MNRANFIVGVILSLGVQLGYGDEAVVVTPVTNPVLHGEGPHWDSETNTLFYVDIESRKVNHYDPATGTLTQAQFVGGGVSLVIPVKDSHAQKLLVTRGHDIFIVDWNQQNATFDLRTNTKNMTFVNSVETEPQKYGNRWNDGKVDNKGRLWAGTMGPEPIVGHVTPNQGSLYLMKPGDSADPIIEVTPVSISNGIAWNKDSTLMYYIDTATNEVDVFDYDLETATISNRRPVINFVDNGIAGVPDGMTIDSNENLWVACFNGGQVINVEPKTGKVLRSVEIPATRVTSLMFGGRDLDVLYVTTSRLGLTEQELASQPHAGSTFAVTGLGVKALAPANNVVP